MRLGLITFAAWTLLLALGGIFGCSSAALPPKPNPVDLARCRATSFPVVVGVERHRFPAYSDRLITSLRATQLFAGVDTLEHVPNAKLVASVDREIYGTATIPCFTFFSLGVIPTVVEEEWGESFSLRAKGSDEPRVHVDFHYSGSSTLGLIAPVLALLPDVTTQHPPATDRYRDALAVRICASADAIRGLIER